MDAAANLHLLTGAYVGGALHSDEHADFVRHLRHCAHCAVEVRELLETTALLGVAAAIPAPPTLRVAVYSEIARTRQQPPVVVPLRDGARGWRRPLRQAALTAAACLAVLSVGLGSYARHVQGTNVDLRRQGAQIAALATAPDARTANADPGSPAARVTVSRSLGAMELVANLVAPPPGRAYQIWLVGPHGIHSAGIFAQSNGETTTRLFSGPGDATSLLVTEERVAGSTQPTSEPVLRMSLPS